ncbi:hypothetical protein DPMN_016860 [Dreissena polymorpha]|uniref:WH1 domain-containing protein n=1 Tax=Dreissena polymorpha TaxID=45954 RepID=A0A9D4NDU6_DREPO|nr:hypothetical protein DPMN_016860 [Dreissena polymorpha]
MVWEQVLTDNFVYKTLSTYFHTFEAHVCQAGLKFASEKEAAHFQKMVEGKLMERVQKRMERQKQRQGNRGNSSGINQPHVTSDVESGAPPAQVYVTSVRNNTNKKDKATKGRKKQLTNER